MIHQTAIIDDNVTIGEGTNVWHFSHILSNTKIGCSCNIGQNVVVGSNVKIGNGCKIQNNVSIHKGVNVEDDVFIGPCVAFTNVKNPRAFINQKNEFKETIIRKGVTIGANATILCGLEIGQYAFIGAGAVVTKDVGDYELVVGNPAKKIGMVDKNGNRVL